MSEVGFKRLSSVHWQGIQKQRSASGIKKKKKNLDIIWVKGSEPLESSFYWKATFSVKWILDLYIYGKLCWGGCPNARYSVLSAWDQNSGHDFSYEVTIVKVMWRE